MMTTGEPYQRDAHISDIWYLRLVGTTEDAWGFGDPYVFRKEAKGDFEKLVSMSVDGFKQYMKTRSLSFEPFRDGCKAASMFWAEYLYRGNHPEREHKDPFWADPSSKPQIVTTDKEKIRFCSVYFRIIKKEGLSEKLSKMPGIEHDAQGQTWVWFRKGNKTLKSAGNTILGWISIQDEYVVGKVHSLERALRLKDKLIKELGAFLVYEKVDGNDLASMPPPSKEDIQKFEEEQRKLLANPEARQFIQQKLEDYYLKEWVVTKIPALDNKTPLQVAKTKEGRLKLEALINRMEMMGKDMPNKPEFDMNLLRKKLGLANKNDNGTASIYQFKVVLNHVNPPVWRRFQVRRDITLHRLSTTILLAMDWDGGHLHQFRIGGMEYGIPHEDYDDDNQLEDEREILLSELAQGDLKRFIYEYDFGDGWEHTVVLEKVLESQKGMKYPVCLEGARSCPPEDCGGPHGYEDFLEAIRNPKHPEHKSMLDWIGEDFDPEDFDVDFINDDLKHIDEEEEFFDGEDD